MTPFLHAEHARKSRARLRITCFAWRNTVLCSTHDWPPAGPDLHHDSILPWVIYFVHYTIV